MNGHDAVSEADEASRGSAIRLAAEVGSRALAFATTVLVLRRLGSAQYGEFGGLSAYALILAELGELGLQTLASRALVAGTLSLRSLVRARLVLALLAGAFALAVIPVAPRVFGGAASGAVLSLLMAWFVLSGWAEFLGVALRCRGARLQEALLLLGLRGSGLAFAATALLSGGGLVAVAAALALSPAPALAAGTFLLRRGRAAAPASGVATVLRQAAPLAAHGGLLLLSPRVELLVVLAVRSRSEAGLFLAALNVIWFLGAVPSAIAAGAMPALTREALRGDGAVRRRTAATLALLGAPAAVGLALVATPLVLLIAGREYASSAVPLQLMSAAVPAIFLNALLAASLIAVGRAAWLPWLTASRVALAFALALVLVPGLGAKGAASGLVCAEWLLLGLGWAACRRAGFAVPVLRPLVWAFSACLPMALAVHGVAQNLPLAVSIGLLTWAATLAAALRLAPGRVRQLTGDLRYP